LSTFKRGTVVTAAARGVSGRKPRPAIVVQSNDYSHDELVVIVPLTSETGGSLLTRPVFAPDQTNGLREASRLMSDRIGSAPLSRLGNSIGTMSSEDMDRVDSALRLLLDLGPA
jgi:mRNA interferase MazF